MVWDAKQIEADQAAMEQARQPFDDYMREAAIWFLPRHQQFEAMKWGAVNIPRGPSQDERIFDPHAQQSMEQSVAVVEGYLIPRGQIWQRWQLPDDELMKLRHVREWVEAKNRLLFQLRNDPKSGFTGNTHESIASLLAMGMQSTWPSIRRDITGRNVGLSYQSEFVGQVYVKTNHQGLVDTVHFAMGLTARKCEQEFGEEAPETAQRAMRDNRPDEIVSIIHAIKPNTAFDPERIDWRGKPWAGCYYERGKQQVFKVGGYRRMPRIVSRYVTAPNEDYGRAPVFHVLPAVRACQQMVQDLILASELAAMPPLAAHSDMLDETIRYAAHEVTYGAIDHRGNRRLVPLYESSDMQGSFTLLDRMQKLIDRALFTDMLQIRQELKSHVTDAQLYQREEEKGILMAPLANQETEWLSPMLDREIDLMDEMDLFADMPGEVGEAIDAGMDPFVPSYDNGLTRAMDAGAAAGYFRLLEQLSPVMQIDQSALEEFKAKYPFSKVLDNLGRINAVPASWEADDTERAATQNAAQQEKMLEQILQAGPAIGKTARDLGAAVPAGAA